MAIQSCDMVLSNQLTVFVIFTCGHRNPQYPHLLRLGAEFWGRERRNNGIRDDSQFGHRTGEIMWHFAWCVVSFPRTCGNMSRLNGDPLASSLSPRCPGDEMEEEWMRGGRAKRWCHPICHRGSQIHLLSSTVLSPVSAYICVAAKHEDMG